MPSRPRSSVGVFGSELSFDAMLMNSRDVDAFAVLSNTRTEPVFWTMYQRALLPGSWSIAIGCVKFGRFGNTRCTSKLTAVLGGSPARQLVLEGRASRPEVGGAFEFVVASTGSDAADTFAGVAASNAR